MFHVKHASPHVLLINPWITDFAAYNLWAKPLGLLYIASLLRRSGFRITLIDCLASYVDRKKFGDGKFSKVRIEKPRTLKSIPRNYSQYGISEASFAQQLRTLKKPDVVAVTSGMTYWYPGLFKTIQVVKRHFPKVPVILGGIYATLCSDHARRHSEADYIITGRGETKALRLLNELTRSADASRLPTESERTSDTFPLSAFQRESTNELSHFSYPCFDLYSQTDFVCISTSRGCPLRCSYCASFLLTQRFSRRTPLDVITEIEFWTREYRIENIAFYDDALLMQPGSHIIPILKQILARGIRCNFHVPNGLHIREIDEELADLLFQCRFKTVRLGFETSNEHHQLESGGKVNNLEFQKTVRNLKRAGYTQEEIGVYILAGLPSQGATEVQESISYVREAGAKPILVEYSPIPGTPLFQKAKQMSPFDIENEPLFQNNSILPCQWEGFTLEDYRKIKTDLQEQEDAR
jgi:radical SAM superfamily enzyme YgiQ (UPF0313 family)